MDHSLKGKGYVWHAHVIVLNDLLRVVLIALPGIAICLLVLLWPVLHLESVQAIFIPLADTLPVLGLQGPDILFSLFSSVIEYSALAAFAVAMHRTTLQHSVALRRPFSASVFPYLGYWFVTTLVFVIVSIAIAIAVGAATRFFLGQDFARLGVVISFLAVIVVGALTLRAILIFPAIAVGDTEMTLVRSERLTRGQSIRIAVSAVLTVLPIALVGGLAVALPAVLLSAMDDVTKGVIQAGFQLVLQFLTGAVFITYVSVLYCHFTDNKLPEEP